MLALQIAAPIGLILGSPLTPLIHRRWDKKPGLVGGTAGWALLQLLPVLMRLLGIFPENGDPLLLHVLVGFKFFQGIVVQQALVSFGSMMADVADEHELRSGRRQEGVYFGAVSFSGKAASGIGNLVAGVGLDLIGWQAATGLVAGEIPAELLFRLGIFYGPVVAGFAVVSVWCHSHYRLDRARHREIVAELKERRAARAAELARVEGDASPEQAG